MPPAVYSSYSSSMRTSSASSGSISSSSRAGWPRGSRQDVGGVVGIHLLEDVGGPLVVEPGEDRDRLLLDHLPEDVGEPLVAECGDDIAATLVGCSVLQRVGEVGRAQLLVRLQQAGRPLVLGCRARAR